MISYSTNRNRSDRTNSIFIGADAKTAEPRSASIHLLGSPTKHGQHLGSVRDTQIPSTSQDETTELLADIDGLPILVRFRLSGVPAEVRSDLVANGSDIS